MVNLKLKQILNDICMYYATRRGVGHTYTMLHGAVNSDRVPTVVAAHRKHAQELQGQSSAISVIALEALPGCLLGAEEPLVFDNYALGVLFSAPLKRILDLEAQLAEKNESQAIY